MARKLMINGDATVSQTNYTLRDIVTDLQTEIPVASNAINIYNGNEESATTSVKTLLDMTTTIESHGGDLLVLAAAPIYSTGGTSWIHILLDGVRQGDYIFCTSNTTARQQYCGYKVLKNVPAGNHTISLAMSPQNTGGSYTVKCSSYTSKSLTVVELPSVNGSSANMILVPSNDNILALIQALNSVQPMVKKQLYSGSLQGSQSVTFDTTLVKRFLEVRVKLYSTYKTFVIDTSKSTTAISGTVTMAEDSTNNYYVCRCSYNKSTGVFGVQQMGYFSCTSDTYTNRNSNSSYIVYEILTYDDITY